MSGENQPTSNNGGDEPVHISIAADGNGAGQRPSTVLSVASLRRASPLHTPTRTLRLDEAEHLSRQDQTGPPSRVTLASLASRPRSNPRSRTPMRYESPLNPSEFRRDSSHLTAAAANTTTTTTADNDEEPSSLRSGTRRTTIRLTTGLAVGTTLPSNSNRTIHEERQRHATPKSRKQGPSHRKVRRWNNDHFEGLASEIAQLRHGHVAAEVLMRAHEDAPLYRSLYDPAEHRSDTITRFLEDKSLKGLRENFFEGETPISAQTPVEKHRHHRHRPPRTAEERMNRMDPRLRNVVAKACSNSEPACKVVRIFEQYVLDSFLQKKQTIHATDETPSQNTISTDWWKDLLVESPTTVSNILKKQKKNNSNKKTIQFLFSASDSRGGFHRLLLHAICQFHGLKAVSRVIHHKVTLRETGEEGTAPAAQATRALLVTGSINSNGKDEVDDSSKYNDHPAAQQMRLLDHLTQAK